MNNNPLVSVIVPVYKTEKGLLRRCVDSIAAQTFGDIEILIILNGNTAEYGKEVRETIHTENARIYETEKAGPSFARNEGIKLAKGEFIAFVDADDEVVPNYIENALKILETTGADVAVGGSKYQFEGYHQLLCYNGSLKLLQGEDVCGRLLTAADGPKDGINGYLFNSAWGKLFRKTALEQVFFHEEVFFYEDMLFMFFIAIKGVTFALSHEVWYIYYQYSDSILHKRNCHVIDCFKTILSSINDAIAGQEREDTLSGMFGSFIFWCIQFSIQLADDFSQYINFIRSCEHLSLFRKSIAACRGRSGRFVISCIKHRIYYNIKKWRQRNLEHQRDSSNDDFSGSSAMTE